MQPNGANYRETIKEKKKNENLGGKGVLYVGPRFGVPGYALLPGLGRPLQASGLPPAWFRYIISILLLFPGLFRVKWAAVAGLGKVEARLSLFLGRGAVVLLDLFQDFCRVKLGFWVVVRSCYNVII